MKTGQIREEVGVLYSRLDRLSGGTLSIAADAIQGFSAARGTQAAAAIAYYALFSLFPLLLVLAAATSFFMEEEQAYQQVVETIASAVPISKEFIERNLSRIAALRGPGGLIGLFASLWSAEGVFTVLVHNINLAWPQAKARGFFEKRLAALAIIATLILLLILSLSSAALLKLVPRVELPGLGPIIIRGTILWPIITRLVGCLFAFLMFAGLYCWVPNIEVKWRAACGGALFAALAWQLATVAFVWYLGSGLARYEIVYGSLAAIVALMFWVYLSGWIALFGAHLAAALDQRDANKQPPLRTP